MKKTMRRLLTAALAIMLVMLMLPAAFAATYTLDTTTDLEAMAAGDKADGDTAKAGTDDYFTVVFSAKTKIDGSKKAFDDGYEATQRLNFGGKTEIAKNRNAVQFTTSGAATVKVWWVCGDNGRQVAIYNEDATVLTQSTVESTKNSLYITEFTLDAAGTYYYGNIDGNNYLFKLEVAEAEDPIDDGAPISPAPGVTYVVKAGDTLGKIALAHYGIVEKYQAIFEANRHILTNPNTIYVGQVLTLPEANLLAPTEGETLYTVQPGDTLGKIALAHYGTMAEYTAIYERNSEHLANPNLIYVGQVLVLPAK